MTTQKHKSIAELLDSLHTKQLLSLYRHLYAGYLDDIPVTKKSLYRASWGEGGVAKYERSAFYVWKNMAEEDSFTICQVKDLLDASEHVKQPRNSN